MRRDTIVRLAGLCVLIFATPGWSGAQAIAGDGRTPAESQADPQGSALQQIVTVTIENLRLPDAIAEVRRQTGITIGYVTREVAAESMRVSYQGKNVTLDRALKALLKETPFEVVVMSGGNLLLRRRQAGMPQRERPAVIGTLVGRVTDAKTGDALIGAEVWLEGTRLRTTTGDRGFYRLTDVAAGTYTVAVRRVGYTKRTQAVTIEDKGEATADVALQPVVTQLNELVTTMTGEQRRLELGHAIGLINADSLVKEAPITTLSELLTARVPGLVVTQTQGTVGGDSRFQIRGATSIQASLGSQPIFIVDGMRISSKAIGGSYLNLERNNPLNDLNPNDVASVELVKGPSAATLYGTDAANGVIVITTKRGQAGQAKWAAFARGITDAVPTNRLEKQYRGWGHDGLGNVISCNLVSVANGLCTQDSVTQSTTLSGSGLSVLRPARSGTYGASVSGGQSSLRYYFGGNYNALTGAVGLPDSVIALFKSQQGVSELPKEIMRPNTQTGLQLRSNVTVALLPGFEVTANAGYTHGLTHAISSGFSPYRTASSSVDTTALLAAIKNSFALSSQEVVDRFMTGATTRVALTSWLTARGAIGLDISTRDRNALLPRDLTRTLSPTGVASDATNKVTVLSSDVGVTAAARKGLLTFRTSIGGQYVRNRFAGINLAGSDLPPGATSAQAAAAVQVFQLYSETATLGGYAEEMVGLNDRFFLTGALRVDGATTFGSGYEAAVYPKLSASWVVSDEPFMPRIPGIGELRLRAAFGVSGKQPDPAWALPTYRLLEEQVPGLTDGAIFLDQLGNPDLRPERTREFEAGLDAGMLGGRARVELTWYKRKTKDQLLNQFLPMGLGTGFTNVGLTSEHGFEAQVSATVLESDAISWDLTVQHSLHGTKLEELGDASPQLSAGGGFVEGYPLGARFVVPIQGFADANGDGIIAPSEVQLGTAPVYMGENYPRATQTLTSTFGMFGRQLRLSALFDREEVTQINVLFACATCRERIDPTTPLATQAAAVAYGFSAVNPRFIESGSYIRLREVAATFSLPDRFVRPMGVSTASLTFSARNLALWSDFTAADPESSSARGPAGLGNGIPMTRTFSLRCDLGL